TFSVDRMSCAVSASVPSRSKTMVGRDGADMEGLGGWSGHRSHASHRRASGPDAPAVAVLESNGRIARRAGCRLEEVMVCLRPRTSLHPSLLAAVALLVV